MAKLSVQDAIATPKIQFGIDQIYNDGQDGKFEASKLSKTTTFRNLSSDTKSRFKTFLKNVHQAEAVTNGAMADCQDGIVQDFSDLRHALTQHYEAVDSLRKFNARLKALDDAEIDARLSIFLTAYVSVQGHRGELIKLERRVRKLIQQLDKASKATKDASAKALIGATLTAFGMVLPPLIGIPALIGGGVVLSVGYIANETFNGNESTKFKKVTGNVAAAVTLTEMVRRMPLNFAPVVALADHLGDMSDIAMSEMDKRALAAEIRSINAKIKTLAPKVAKDLKKLKSINSDVNVRLIRAKKAVRSFRAGGSAPNMSWLKL